ncbi:MAG: hypothetical protein IJW26_03330, partial [Clostridia bacterium]|nr:hypothetical protein [Clostridia bacterium]
MKSKTLGIIGGSLFLLQVILSIAHLGLVFYLDFAKGSKLIVILLSNVLQILLIICLLIIAFSMLKNECDKGIFTGLLISLILSIINVLSVFPTQFTTAPLIAIMQIMAVIVPKLLLIILYVKNRNYSSIKTWYLPALIFFISNSFTTYASIINYLVVITTYSPVLSILGLIVTTLAYLVL